MKKGVWISRLVINARIYGRVPRKVEKRDGKMSRQRARARVFEGLFKGVLDPAIYLSGRINKNGWRDHSAT